MKIIDRIKQHLRLRSAWRAVRDARRRLSEDELNAIARRLGWKSVLQPRPMSDPELCDFHRQWAEAADKDASRHAEFTPWGTGPLTAAYESLAALQEATRHGDYSGLPPLGNTDRRERLLSLARQAGVPCGTPGILEFAELVAADVICQEPDTLV